MPRRFSVAVLGGTFDRLHRGHRVLLGKAFEVADRVGIGVTTSAYLRRFPKPQASRLTSYRTRRLALRRYLERHFRGRKYWMAPLDDPFGRSLDPEVGALILSRGTRSGGNAVNRLRRARGLAPVKLVEVRMALGDDGFAISSRRIRAGIIDREGHRRVPLPVSIRPASFRRRVDPQRLAQPFPTLRLALGQAVRGEPGSREGLRVTISEPGPGTGFSARVSRVGAEFPARASSRGSGGDPTTAVIAAIRRMLR